MLTHTTAWDRLWRGDETLNCVVYTWLGFALPSNAAAAVAVASLKVYLTTLLIKVFSFSNFLGGRDGDGDGTDGQTDISMDRQTFLGKYYFRLKCKSN